jgi:hypothetical protein
MMKKAPDSVSDRLVQIPHEGLVQDGLPMFLEIEHENVIESQIAIDREPS